MPLTRIISGGQTGVDRGALDAALAAGFPCGGWCPPGRLAEDGAIDARYPMREMPRGSYDERTRQNVIDSDGTAVIHFGEVTGGTALTVHECEANARPFALIDATRTSPADAAEAIGDFIAAHRITTLNVAGPRASGAPGAHTYAREVLGRVLATARRDR